METRICISCNKNKPLNNFKYLGINSYNKTCKQCLRIKKFGKDFYNHPNCKIDYSKLNIIDLYNKGHSSIEIVELLNLNVTPRSVQRFLKKNGALVRSQGESFKLAIQKGRMNWKHLRKDKKSKEYRKGISDVLRYQILSRDNFKCILCGSSTEDGISLQIDHIIRPEDGGDNSMGNLRTLCYSCNFGRYFSEDHVSHSAKRM